MCCFLHKGLTLTNQLITPGSMSDKKKRKVHQIDEPEETQFTKITQKKNWQKNVVTALCPLIDEELDKEKRIKIYTYQCPFEASGRCRSRSVRL